MKTLTLTAIVVALAICVSVAKANTVKYTTRDSWDACAADVAKEHKGEDLGNTGLMTMMLDVCGYVPEPTPQQLKKDLDLILQFCGSRDEGLTTTGMAVRTYMFYNPSGQAMKEITAQCIAKSKAEKAKEAKLAKKQHNKINHDFRVARLYESSSISMSVVIETSKARHVKCALYDSAGDPLSVNTGIITPPVDELVIMVKGGTQSAMRVQCWDMK